MATWIESLRSRCGPFADAARRFAELEGVAFDPPRGVAALCALQRALELHRARHGGDDGDDDAERAFVERAGAFLAVVVLDHLRAGRHARRDGSHHVAFGRHASFDPFAAIERTLEAHDAGDALALEVALAERAARARGRPAGSDDEPWGEARPRVLPRLVGPRLLAEMGKAGEHVFWQPLAGDIRLAMILRYPGRARFVRHRERARWPVGACGHAIRNLARSSAHAKLVRVDGDEGSFVTARSADGLDASRLLLPGLHDVLAPELGSPFVAAVPHRDALFACAAHAGASVAALAARTRIQHDRARHGISASLVLVHPGAILTPFPAPQ